MNRLARVLRGYLLPLAVLSIAAGAADGAVACLSVHTSTAAGHAPGGATLVAAPVRGPSARALPSPSVREASEDERRLAPGGDERWSPSPTGLHGPPGAPDALPVAGYGVADIRRHPSRTLLPGAALHGSAFAPRAPPFLPSIERIR